MSECCNQFIMEESMDEFEMTENLKGDPGPGVAPGGTTGQILAKASDEDYDTEWIDQPELDAGHVEYDPAETYSDGTVGKELGTINSALSSLSAVTEIIDTASGAIASFPDGAGLPMRSLVAQIEPQQDLHGQTSPYPAGGGSNQWDEQWENGDISSSGGENEGNDNLIRTVGYIPVDASKTYYFFCGSQTSGSPRARFYDQNKGYIGYTTASGQMVSINASFTPPSGAYYMRFAMQATYGATYKNDIAINYPATVTTYAPYSNECPITGWTGLSGSVAGKNLLPNKKYQRGTNYVYLGQDVDHNYFPIHLKAGTYTLACNNAVKASLNYKISDGSTVQIHSSRVNNYDKFTLEKDGDYQFWLYNGEGISPSDVTEFQLEIGETKTAYEAYVTPNPITVSWQSEAGTVYGGTVDVVTGVLTVDTAVETENGGNPYWQLNTGGVGRFYLPVLPTGLNTSKKAESICNVGTYRDDNSVYGAYFAYGGSGLYVNKISASETLEQFKTRISNPALQIIYPLAQPQTYQLSPQQILTLIGNNTVFVDCGSVSVTYQANLKGYIDKVLAS